MLVRIERLCTETNVHRNTEEWKYVASVGSTSNQAGELSY